jgi:putative ABC transport system permease protein
MKDGEAFARALRATRRGAVRPARSTLGSAGHDCKVALRLLRQRPGFSWMVIGMLALGIAGNTAIFSFFNGLFLRPWPLPESERLVDLDETAPKWNLEYVGVAIPDYMAWEKDNSTFESMAFSSDDGFNLTAPDGSSSRVDGAQVTWRMLHVLKLRPVVGRSFRAEEDRPKGPKVVMLGYALWQGQFHGDPKVVGRIVKLNEEGYTVIGVLPRDAVYPLRAEVWVPLGADPKEGDAWFLSGVGRLKAGVTIEQARQDLLRVHKNMIQGVKRGVNEITSPRVTGLRERTLGDYRQATQILLGGVAVLLLIVCVNVAGLMLVRASSRAREIAVRTALGAVRAAIIRQLLIESLVLSLVGGALGVLLGGMALRGLLRLAADVLPDWIVFPLDLRCALFCAGITGLAAILFGLAPALHASRVDARQWLQDGARSSWSRGRQRTLNALTAGEVALALVLLACSAMLLQSFRKVLAVNPGFRADHLLSFRVWLPEAKYEKREQRIAFYDALLERLRALPGVTAAGAASLLPLSGHMGHFAEVEGGWKPGPNEKNPVVLEVIASPGYLEALGVTLLKGRWFNEADGLSAGARVAIINESFAKQFWPNTDPIGKRLRYGPTGKDFIPVVGVTRDMKHYGLDQPMRPSIIVPMRQRPRQSMAIVLRSTQDPRLLVGSARAALRQLDLELPMGEVRMMSERLDRSLWFRRAFSWLFWVFAAVATLLAAAGIYGVTSYAVAQRVREFGIRMALGARPAAVMTAVLRRSLALLAAGASLGLVGAWFASRLLESVLFGVRVDDPWPYVGVMGVVAAAGLLAGLVPALRAAATEPMAILRAE